MESIIAYIVTPVILFLLICYLWKSYIESKRDPNSPLPLPPGGVGWPFIGEMPSLIYEAMFQGRDFFGKRLKLHGCIYKTHLFGKPTIRLCGAENIRQYMVKEHSHMTSDWPDGVKRLQGKYALGSARGEFHKNMRKHVLRAFTTESLSSYMSPIWDILGTHMDRWSVEGRVCIGNKITSLVFDIASQILVGIRDSSRKPEMEKYVNDYMNGFFKPAINLPFTAFGKAVQARDKLIEEMESINSNTKENGHSPGSPYTDAYRTILDAKDNALDGAGSVSPEEAHDLCLELLFAGTITTNSALTSMVFNLGSNPTVVKKLEAEISDIENYSDLTYEALQKLNYLDKVFKESLRTIPPISGAYRKASKTVQIGDYQIPAGWSVMCSIRGTHKQYKDPVFDPEKFIPERWTDDQKHNRNMDYAFVPFGSGPRVCVGKKFAELLIKMFVVMFVKNYKMNLTEEENEMHIFPTPTFKNGLPVLFTHKI